jgi:hypothetical protein
LFSLEIYQLWAISSQKILYRSHTFKNKIKFPSGENSSQKKNDAFT